MDRNEPEKLKNRQWGMQYDVTTRWRTAWKRQSVRHPPVHWHSVGAWLQVWHCLRPQFVHCSPTVCAHRRLLRTTRLCKASSAQDYFSDVEPRLQWTPQHNHWRVDWQQVIFLSLSGYILGYNGRHVHTRCYRGEYLVKLILRWLLEKNSCVDTAQLLKRKIQLQYFSLQ